MIKQLTAALVATAILAAVPLTANAKEPTAPSQSTVSNFFADNAAAAVRLELTHESQEQHGE